MLAEKIDDAECVKRVQLGAILGSASVRFRPQKAISLLPATALIPGEMRRT